MFTTLNYSYVPVTGSQPTAVTSHPQGVRLRKRGRDSPSLLLIYTMQKGGAKGRKGGIENK